jgi:hypothetical protein
MQNSTTDRKGPDGLTVAERATLRDPRTYEVAELNSCHFLASARDCFADFDVVLAYGRFVRVKSNTGSTHDLMIGEPCSCLDKLHRAAEDNCKHEAALEAVLLYRAQQGEQSIRQLRKAA